MHKIAKNGIITLTAGDSLFLPLYIEYANEDGTYDHYILEAGDKIYFSITEPNRPFEFGVVRKICDISNLDKHGYVIIELTAADTEFLRAGLYYYEVKFSVKRNNKEYVDTIIPKRKFFII